MLKKIYSCNLCGTDYHDWEKRTHELIGLNFSGMRKFTLDKPESTDGYHICIWCAGQIVMQAPPLLEGKVVMNKGNDSKDQPTAKTQKEIAESVAELAKAGFPILANVHIDENGVVSALNGAPLRHQSGTEGRLYFGELPD